MKNTIINFWKKKLTRRIFNNMISKRKIKPSNFENEICQKLIEKDMKSKIFFCFS